jgi:hypothetical protein
MPDATSTSALQTGGTQTGDTTTTTHTGGQTTATGTTAATATTGATAGDGKTGTVLSTGDGKTTDTTTTTVASVWGDDWREKYADKDDKRLNVLKRYASPKDVLDAHFALKQKVDSGELKAVKALPANANPQEIAAYRKDNGIPENAGDYLVNLPNGLVVGEADKPALTAFAEAMHKANTPPAVVHQVIGWYNQWQEQQAADLAKADEAAKRTNEDALRADWGKDYRTNLNVANEFLVSTAGDLASDIMEAVLPDGTRLGDSAKALQWLARTAREVNPASTLVPGGGGGDSGATVDSEIASIEKVMREKRGEYNRDQKMQQRYMQLLEARDRMKARKAG